MCTNFNISSVFHLYIEILRYSNTFFGINTFEWFLISLVYWIKFNLDSFEMIDNQSENNTFCLKLWYCFIFTLKYSGITIHFWNHNTFLLLREWFLISIVYWIKIHLDGIEIIDNQSENNSFCFVWSFDIVFFFEHISSAPSFPNLVYYSAFRVKHQTWMLL